MGWLLSKRAAGILFFGFFFAVPLLGVNQFYLYVATLVLIYVILALGLNVLVGYAGQLAFANAAREAEIYAATMHRKLGVVIRVSNAKPPTNVMDVFQRIAQLDVPGSAARSSPFVEQAGVAIDYELLP